MNNQFLALLNRFLFAINILAVAMILLAVFVVYFFNKKSKQQRNKVLRDFVREELNEELNENKDEEEGDSDLMFKVDSQDSVPEIFW